MQNEILISLLLFTIIQVGLSWRPYKFRITSAIGECFDKLCNVSVTLNETSLEVGAEFSTDNEFEPITFNFILFMINVDKTEKVLFNKTVEICAFLQNKKSDQLFTILYNDMKKYGNLLTRCPLKGRLYLKNYVVDTEKLPPYMPYMKTRINIFMTGRLANTKGKQINLAKFEIAGLVDNSAGVNRLIKING